MVNIEEYCKDPGQYRDQLPVVTAAFWDSICTARRALNFNHFGELFDKFGGEIGKFLEHLPQNFINFILSPQGIEIMSFWKGVDLTAKMIYKSVLKMIAKGIGAGVSKIAEEMAEKEGAAAVSSSILTKLVEDAVEDAVMERLAFMFAELIIGAVDLAFAIFNITNILGIILDLLSPQGFNEMLSYDMMQTIMDEFNGYFEAEMLSIVSVVKNQYGDKIIVEKWPVVYYADYFLANEKGSKDYKTLSFLYQMEYLTNLEYNSDGYRINWPKGGNIVNQSQLDKVAFQMELQIADQNTSVALFVIKWGFLILLIIIIIIFLLFIIK